MSPRPHPALTRPERILQVAGDMLFELTTRPIADVSIASETLSNALRLLLEKGWTIRRAGPRWYVVWNSDRDRLLRRRILMLPEQWVGLTTAETASLLAIQLQQLGLASPDRGALAASQRDIWAKLARAGGGR